MTNSGQWAMEGNGIRPRGLKLRRAVKRSVCGLMFGPRSLSCLMEEGSPGGHLDLQADFV